LTWAAGPYRSHGWRGLLIGTAVGGGGALLAGGLGPGAAIAVLASALAGYFCGRVVDYQIQLRNIHPQIEQQATSLLESLRETEKLNEELQDRVVTRTEELSNANERLQKAFGDLEASQEKALAAERQAVIGVLAAGMAHEINSPLNGIRLSLQAIREDLGPESPVASLLQTADRATSRCKRIVDDLLSFAREPRQTRRIALEEILVASLALFQKESGRDIDLSVDLGDNLPRLYLDRAQIQQAIFNILSNAADAMGGKGKIHVKLASEDDELVLRIADNGPGMSEELQQKIFDPFFTTKTGGKGTGLGLSITYQLVRRNGGTVEVASREGEGATFTLRFRAAGNARDTMAATGGE
jgi:signal transduction histidine kinase